MTIPVWEDHAWPALPPLSGAQQADVCVVGLGGSGLACIGELLSLGKRVIGIDAAKVGGGAAGRNGGFLLTGLPDFYHIATEQIGRHRAAAIYRLTLSEINRMASETPAVVRRVGSLRLASTLEEAEDCRRQLDAMRADGLPAEPYQGPEGLGLLISTDGSFHPLRRCRMLALRAIKAGARLFENSPAREIEGGEVSTPDGLIQCEKVIVCVDGALRRVLPELHDRVRPARLQMLATAPTSEVRLPRPVYARWGLDYWQWLPNGRLVMGGFRDAGGEEEWTEAPETTPKVQSAIEGFLRQKLGVTSAITHRWAATVAYTDSRLPIIEEVRPGVWAVGAYSGTGNVLGSICGRAAARAAFGRGMDVVEMLGDRGAWSGRPTAQLPALE